MLRRGDAARDDQRISALKVEAGECEGEEGVNWEEATGGCPFEAADLAASLSESFTGAARTKFERIFCGANDTAAPPAIIAPPPPHARRSRQLRRRPHLHRRRLELRRMGRHALPARLPANHTTTERINDLRVPRRVPRRHGPSLPSAVVAAHAAGRVPTSATIAIDTFAIAPGAIAASTARQRACLDDPTFIDTSGFTKPATRAPPSRRRS